MILGFGKIKIVNFMFEIDSDIYSNSVINKYSRLSKIGKRVVSIVRGNIIVLTIGTTIILITILIIFIS